MDWVDPLRMDNKHARPAYGPVLFEAVGADIRKSFASTCLREVFDVWQGYREESALPNKDKIEPLDFFRWLPNVMLVGVENDGGGRHFRVRLNGEIHVGIAGTNMAGRRFEETPAVVNDDGGVIGVFHGVAETGQPHYWRRKYINPSMNWNTYERCLLPFVGDDGSIQTLMAVAQVFTREE